MLEQPCRISQKNKTRLRKLRQNQKNNISENCDTTTKTQKETNSLCCNNHVGISEKTRPGKLRQNWKQNGFVGIHFIDAIKEGSTE